MRSAYEFHTRVVNLFPFIIRREILRRTSGSQFLSLSLSFFRKGMNRACLRGLKRRGVFRRTTGYRLWKCGRVPAEKQLTRGRRREVLEERTEADITDSEKTAHARCARTEDFPLAFPRSFTFLVSKESLNYFASFEPRQRNRATRQPLHKVGSMRVNETPLRHFFVG